MCWRKIYLHEDAACRELLVKTCDKVRMRDFVSERFGPELLTDRFCHAKSSRFLPWELAPEKFVVKANHGSTWNFFVHDKAHANLEAIHTLCDSWLDQTWGAFAGEWWYGHVTPQVLFEELLCDTNAPGPPTDYKFFVMRGEVNLVQVDFDRFTSHKRNLYTPGWQRIPCGLKVPTGRNQPKPRNLARMLEIASVLGQEFDFVRVDLYEIGNRIVVGELTHCPGSGWEKFTAPEVDRWLGSRILLPSGPGSSRKY
jgi:hypothetical protein